MHGGVYTLEANKLIKPFIFSLLKKINIKLTFIDYPLSPENNCLDTVNMVIKTYKILVNNNKNDKFLLMGDSAGGGLSLVVAQYLRDKSFFKRPVGLILFSPWIDLEMKNKRIKENEKS